MAYSLILRPDLQDILNRYTEMRDKLVALNAFSEEQRKILESEREQSKILKERMKKLLCWMFKREDEYKASLDSLNKRNNELQRDLANVKLERERAEHTNDVKVLKLQEEVDYLRKQVAQFEDKLKQQLMLQNYDHKSEISEYKRLLEDSNARISFLERNAARKTKLHNVESHPALTNETETKKTETKRKHNLADKLLVKVEKVQKRRKLFREDEENVFDIV
ncbi:serine/threonine-protein kinase mrck-1-like [Pseudomyrmex gracilis]|uniref:serine/threonine-protein kinase mrck-1-like n=1 Tax=Pseudomyrmex gracilis TaxID=219809 RepID=UPI0009953D63|nr:serine/threonine-protein kinase mrck-1-like [Pseudomyrmex gracilis]